jgi:hypothetical protein
VAEQNYRPDFQEYIYRRIEQHLPENIPDHMNTPTRHNYYCAIRSVIRLRLTPEVVFKPGGNSKMDLGTYERLIKLVDEILPEKEEEQ